MANWAMDSLIETVQKYYHKMNFHTGKSNGWFKHSAHIMLISKASRIVAEEYSKLRATEDRDAKFVDHDDHNLNTPKAIKNTENSSIPRRERESSAVAEYVFLSKMTKDIIGRSYNDEEMWKRNQERAERMVRQSQTSEEILVDRYKNSLYNSSDSILENGININENVEDATVVEMDPAMMAENCAILDDHTTIDENNEKREAAVKGIGNIKKCAVNNISISKDIISYGRMEIQKWICNQFVLKK